MRCFVGDNEDRWFMWYSGRGAGDAGMDAVAPAAGSIGAALPGCMRIYGMMSIPGALSCMRYAACMVEALQAARLQAGRCTVPRMQAWRCPAMA